jgi:AcrR family transcriptional regulator
LIKAAEQVFVAKGYVATTMADIAAAAVMSKKTIYQIFNSKTELFDCLMMECVVRLPMPEADSPEPPLETLRDMLLSYGRALLSPRQITLTRLILANIASVPEVDERLKQRCGEAQDMLERWFIRVAERGGLRIRNAQAAAEMLFTLAFGGIQSALLLDLRALPTEAELAARVDWSIGVFLREFTV